ncbi:uncharacterized protein FTOL_06528 [Fusarium torulosum]|uniref:Uncharacterized protein n=1 Tax=Fusarium torulosum TaxID=33205 RepID=A0AAE8M973_9HYPO|nr:uncharacterized protein FTOL_06528 [Fusarium torulosum]
MVNVLTIISTLAAVSAVQACKQTCAVASATNNVCTYICTNVCEDISAQQARNTFLAALQGAGNSCTAVGTTNISCRKLNAFGSCYDHHWSCGRGC